ncbi:MAG: helix-turn-helix domain-containing protein [Oscillospiraceae bacterium]
MLFGRFLELRKQTNITQRDISSYLSIAQPSYIRSENGSHEPTLDNLAKLLDLFDVLVDYLIGRSNYRQYIPHRVPFSGQLRL